MAQSLEIKRRQMLNFESQRRLQRQFEVVVEDSMYRDSATLQQPWTEPGEMYDYEYPYNNTDGHGLSAPHRPSEKNGSDNRDNGATYSMFPGVEGCDAILHIDQNQDGHSYITNSTDLHDEQGRETEPLTNINYISSESHFHDLSGSAISLRCDRKAAPPQASAISYRHKPVRETVPRLSKAFVNKSSYITATRASAADANLPSNGPKIDTFLVGINDAQYSICNEQKGVDEEKGNMDETQDEYGDDDDFEDDIPVTAVPPARTSAAGSAGNTGKPYGAEKGGNIIASKTKSKAMSDGNDSDDSEDPTDRIATDLISQQAADEVLRRREKGRKFLEEKRVSAAKQEKQAQVSERRRQEQKQKALSTLQQTVQTLNEKRSTTKKYHTLMAATNKDLANIDKTTERHARGGPMHMQRPLDGHLHVLGSDRHTVENDGIAEQVIEHFHRVGPLHAPSSSSCSSSTASFHPFSSTLAINELHHDFDTSENEGERGGEHKEIERKGCLNDLHNPVVSATNSSRLDAHAVEQQSRPNTSMSLHQKDQHMHVSQPAHKSTLGSKHANAASTSHSTSTKIAIVTATTTTRNHSAARDSLGRGQGTGTKPLRGGPRKAVTRHDFSATSKFTTSVRRPAVPIVPTAGGRVNARNRAAKDPLRNRRSEGALVS